MAEKTAADVVRYLRDIAEMREDLARFNPEIGKNAPSNIWDMGTWMWMPGAEHLPVQWRTETVPKYFGLAETPTFKVCRAIVEQIVAALVPSVPKIEFSVEAGADIFPPDMAEAYNEHADESPGEYLSRILNGAWLSMIERSRFQSELSLSILDACLYSLGWLGLHEKPGGIYVQSVHPQIVLWNLDAQREYEIDWVAKMIPSAFSTPLASSEELNAILRWPEKILPKPGAQELYIELWVRKGGRFAGKVYPDGRRMILRSNGRVELDDVWPSTELPLTPVLLEPGHHLLSTPLMATLWPIQMEIDQIMAVILARAARASGETIQIGSGAPGQILQPAGVKLNDSTDVALRKPGTRVITFDGEMKIFEPPNVPADWIALLSKMVENMERLAGVTPPWLGMLPSGVESGVAIQALAVTGGRRINRMATHLAESLESFARSWAIQQLDAIGITERLPMDVKVTLEVNEETTRKARYLAVVELARAGLTIPPELYVMVIPGLTESDRKRILDDIIANEEARLMVGLQGPAHARGQAPLPAETPTGLPSGDEGKPPGLSPMPTPGEGG